jgi:hypothetical protein
VSAYSSRPPTPPPLSPLPPPPTPPPRHSNVFAGGFSWSCCFLRGDRQACSLASNELGFWGRDGCARLSRGGRQNNVWASCIAIDHARRSNCVVRHAADISTGKLAEWCGWGSSTLAWRHRRRLDVSMHHAVASAEDDRLATGFTTRTTWHNPRPDSSTAYRRAPNREATCSAAVECCRLCA